MLKATQVYVEDHGRKIFFSSIYPTYDWVLNHGYENLANWVESAAQAAGR